MSVTSVTKTKLTNIQELQITVTYDFNSSGSKVGNPRNTKITESTYALLNLKFGCVPQIGPNHYILDGGRTLSVKYTCKISYD